VNQARRAAGLTQRELAQRAGVPQAAVARIERGQQVPRADTLARLLDACGFELRLAPKRGAGVDRSLIAHWLSLSPAERAEGTADYGRALDVLRRARRVG
jgi:transcriptional regulator with XRE-family HTH domain